MPSKAKKADFVKAPNVQLANPDYAALHSVPHGHLGWGFDVNGCLSLHRTRIVHNKLKHHWVYVERRAVEVKVELDEDCQIVEDPNGSK